jgi:hypothetical protein
LHSANTSTRKWAIVGQAVWQRLLRKLWRITNIPTGALARIVIICADFGNTTYNWNNPTDDDYMKLSLHVGIAMDMRYSRYGSSPPLHDNMYKLQD